MFTLCPLLPSRRSHWLLAWVTLIGCSHFISFQLAVLKKHTGVNLKYVREELGRFDYTSFDDYADHAFQLAFLLIFPAALP